MAEHRSLIDITSLNGIESLFRRGIVDPWGPHIAGLFADLFVYSELVRFTMPVHGEIPFVDDVHVPELLKMLRTRDRAVFEPVKYETEVRRTLAPEYIEPAFRSFYTWAKINKASLRALLRLHREPWLLEGHLARVRPRYVFDVDVLRSNAHLEHLASTIGVPEDDILYGFDVVLRYPLYGELAGPNVFFLAHPIRELQNLPP